MSTPEVHLPDQKITSEEIELKLDSLYKKLKLPHGRLELMTGIKERRYWGPGTLPSDVAAKAAKGLLSKYQIDPSSIDQLIHASVCRDFLEPSTASIVHHKLELKQECMIYDLSNACLGVQSSILTSAKLIESGHIKNALIVSGENGGPLLFNTIESLLKSTHINRKSIKKYIANLTIGSAAVAVFISGEKTKATPHQLIGGAGLCDTSAHHLCHGTGTPNSLMMETNSEELLKKGIPLSQKSIEKMLHQLHWSRDDLNYVIGHQVGSAHEEQTFKAMGVDHLKSISTYEFLGNTGSAALPVTLNRLHTEINPSPGSKIALLGIGSGLNTLMMGILW